MFLSVAACSDSQKEDIEKLTGNGSRPIMQTSSSMASLRKLTRSHFLDDPDTIEKAASDNRTGPVVKRKKL